MGPFQLQLPPFWLVVGTSGKKGVALHIPHEDMSGIHDTPNYIEIPMFCKNTIDILSTFKIKSSLPRMGLCTK